MNGLLRILTAWALAIVVTVVAALLTGGAAPTSSRVREGLLGIGLIVGLPMLAFALLAAAPLSVMLQFVRPIWLAAAAASLACAGAAWLIGEQVFPPDWRGAAQAFTLFAAVLGLCWGLLGYWMYRAQPIS